MQAGHFYFIKDQYFVDFPDPYLMKNKEAVGGVLHNRPCFYAIPDYKTNLFWMIPISSRVSKYKKIYNEKMGKYGRCDTILFGKVLGHESAFLIQNMCPVSDKYIECEYQDAHDNAPVRVDNRLEKQLIQDSKKVLSLQRNGSLLIFPNVLEIEKKLLEQLET